MRAVAEYLPVHDVEASFAKFLLLWAFRNTAIPIKRTFSPSPIVTPRHHYLGEPNDYLYRNNRRPFLARVIP
jgi:hypothetical protein